MKISQRGEVARENPRMEPNPWNNLPLDAFASWLLRELVGPRHCRAACFNKSELNVPAIKKISHIEITVKELRVAV